MWTSFSGFILNFKLICFLNIAIFVKIEVQKYHAEVWPGVLSRLEQSNIRNFTIYYSPSQGRFSVLQFYICRCCYVNETPSKQLLFSHMEYVGDDFAADSQAIADHPETRVKY